MILFWLGLFTLHLVCGAALVPSRPSPARKDWQFYAAHGLFYSILVSSIWASDLPSNGQLTVGLLLFVTGSVLHLWALRSNPFFTHVIQRPPRVIRTGAYRWLQHPGYVGMFLMASASWLLVGHRLAVIPLALYAALLVWRGRAESLILQAINCQPECDCPD